MKLSPGQILAIGAVGIAGVVVWQTRRAVSDAVSDAANAVNPANNDNIINRGFNSLLGFTQRGTSFGSAIFDTFNKRFDPNEAPPKPDPIRGPSE